MAEWKSVLVLVAYMLPGSIVLLSTGTSAWVVFPSLALAQLGGQVVGRVRAQHNAH